MKKQNPPQQTHFIGVLTPEDITLTLEDCRRYMNEAYGCHSILINRSDRPSQDYGQEFTVTNVMEIWDFVQF